ncbi:MAG: Crp/Fnr family transcriptional regulator [Vitreoscilla sp.]|nr:Crp/Fnr family transcriptional regulator [Vitreoscilla sp.]
MTNAEWLRGLSPTLVALGMTPDVAASVAGELRAGAFAPGEVVERRGDVAAAWMQVSSGLLGSALCLAPNGAGAPLGEPHPLMLHGPGTWCGEAPLLSGCACPLDTIALLPTEVIFMPAPAFRRALDSCPYFTRHVFNLVGLRAARMLEILLAFKHASPAYRLAYTLAHLAEALDPRCGFSLQAATRERIDIDLPQAAIGRLCGISRTVASSLLIAWREAGWLEVQYARVGVLHAGAWRALARNWRESPEMATDIDPAGVLLALEGARNGPRLVATT